MKSARRRCEFKAATGVSAMLSNTTRWNGWLAMIKRGLQCRTVIRNIQHAHDHMEHTILQRRHWQLLEELIEFLHPLQKVTKLCEGDNATLDQVLMSMNSYTSTMKSTRLSILLPIHCLPSLYRPANLHSINGKLLTTTRLPMPPRRSSSIPAIASTISTSTGVSRGEHQLLVQHVLCGILRTKTRFELFRQCHRQKRRSQKGLLSGRLLCGIQAKSIYPRSSSTSP